MFFKLLILSVILVAVILLTLGIKLILDPKAEFSAHSCSSSEEDTGDAGACSSCQLKGVSDCPVEPVERS